MTDKKKLHLATRVIHGGQQPDPSTGAIMTPIYATSTYVQSSPGVHQGYEYSRSQNPTRHAFERCIANLENGHAAYAFASGLSAIAITLELLQPGDHVIAIDDLYGGTRRLFDRVRAVSAGLEFSYVDLATEDVLEQTLSENLKPKTRMIWVETPSNPLLKIANLDKISRFAKKHNLICVADNTFATPYLQQPINYGFDIVVHSATKYINGHSDVISGIIVVGNNAEINERIAFLQNSVGPIASPFDSFLALRGVKTLAIRMQRHNENAMQIAQWLEQHPQIERVIYPGLESHPYHSLAKQQMSGFGGMISILLREHPEMAIDQYARKMLEKCQLFALAESLGGVESLIEHPGMMTHTSLSKEIREELGITDKLIRISVGIENVEDLINDLDQALALN